VLQKRIICNIFDSWLHIDNKTITSGPLTQVKATPGSHPGVGPSQPTEKSKNDGDFRKEFRLKRPLFAPKTGP